MTNGIGDEFLRRQVQFRVHRQGQDLPAQTFRHGERTFSLTLIGIRLLQMERHRIIYHRGDAPFRQKGLQGIAAAMRHPEGVLVEHVGTVRRPRRDDDSLHVRQQAVVAGSSSLPSLRVLIQVFQFHIEDGRLPEADFLELSACTQGCVGGCFNVENPYAAKLRLKGLMSVLPIDAPDEMYDGLKRLFDKLKEKYPSAEYLSAGMSGDYEKAVLRGANMIRPGSLLFGERSYPARD